jgi:hypothetical protein
MAERKEQEEPMGSESTARALVGAFRGATHPSTVHPAFEPTSSQATLQALLFSMLKTITSDNTVKGFPSF